MFIESGIYSIPEAARLTRVSTSRIRRWLKGYEFKTKKQKLRSGPVWTGQLAPISGKMAIGFKDLMEIRYVAAFINAGVSWKTMRQAHSAAKEKLRTDHPFCSHRFATDGRDILHEEAEESGDKQLFNITNDQREFERIVSPFLKELEFEQGITRWWPLGKNRSVVLDPGRNMGQPSVASAGVPTKVLARSVETNGSIDSVAKWYEVDCAEIQDAVEFEQMLAA
jgi:uncharacterized protein (DUF433 family)